MPCPYFWGHVWTLVDEGWFNRTQASSISSKMNGFSVYVGDWFKGDVARAWDFLDFWCFFPHKWLDRFCLRSIRANNSSFELVLPMGFLFCCCYHRLWRCGRACVFLALRLLLLHDDGGSWGGSWTTWKCPWKRTGIEELWTWLKGFLKHY